VRLREQMTGVQLLHIMPKPCDEASEAGKAGWQCSITADVEQGRTHGVKATTPPWVFCFSFFGRIEFGTDFAIYIGVTFK